MKYQRAAPFAPPPDQDALAPGTSTPSAADVVLVPVARLDVASRPVADQSAVRALGLFFKVAAVGFFCVAWLAIGALLPGRMSGEQSPVTSANAVEPTTPEPHQPAKLELPAPEVERSKLARPIDAPSVGPSLPPGGAYEVAMRIDHELDRALATGSVPASPLADDAEFLRRAYLDLVGRIPTRDQTVAFLDDRDPTKRSKLVDRLLADEHFGEHFAETWAELIVKRDFDNNRGLNPSPFVRWLKERLNQGDKWDRIVSAMLTAEGKESDNPATFFLLANQDNMQPAPSKLVGSVGNLFMGIKIECAECHVHPYVSKWRTSDFWGLAAFFGHLRAERELDDNNRPKLGTASFVERDTNAEVKNVPPRLRPPPLPKGATIAIPDPTNPRRTLETVKAKFFEGSQPKLADKGPYRPKFAEWLTSKENPYFATAMVNRTWAHFFGRGFVNSLDDARPDNPPSHPSLLASLASEFARSGYDLKHLVRSICNTRAYQRTSRPRPTNAQDDKLFSRQTVRVLSAEVLLDSLGVATGKARSDGSGRRTPFQRRGNEGGLVRFFDTREYDDDPSEYSTGIPQVLRLMNGDLTRSSNDVAARLVKSGEPPAKIVEELYLTVLSRRPSAAETSHLVEFANRHGDPAKGFAGVCWALLNSAEFACNR